MSEIKIDQKEVTKRLNAKKRNLFFVQDISGVRLYTSMISPIQQEQYNNKFSTFKSVASHVDIVLSTSLHKMQKFELAKNVRTTLKAKLTDPQKADLAFVFAVNSLAQFDLKTVEQLRAEIEAELKAEKA